MIEGNQQPIIGVIALGFVGLIVGASSSVAIGTPPLHAINPTYGPGCAVDGRAG